MTWHKHPPKLEGKSVVPGETGPTLQIPQKEKLQTLSELESKPGSGIDNTEIMERTENLENNGNKKDGVYGPSPSKKVKLSGRI